MSRTKATSKNPFPNSLNIVRKYFPGVGSVRDGDKNIEIEVTEKDNRESTPLSHSVCAFAVACKRSLHADGVLIGMKTAYVIYGKKAVRYRLNESTSREIVSFDRNAGFYSGRYQLIAPGESVQLGKIYGGQKGGKSDRKVQIRHITANVRTMLGRGEPKGAEQ